ncbi:MAG: hypothetical protein WCE94_03725 [Candidatus Methanoperedens sp.]
MFYTNPPKDFLRREYDAVIIRDKFFDAYEDVVYFGMPGPLMLDIQEWNDYLGFIIAVENKQESTGVMEMTAMSLGLNGKTQILQGDIESILMNWEDDVGEIPAKEFFHVVNLDFEGGFLGLTDIIKQDKRTDAIRELFRHQKTQRQSFLFFLTVGFREKCEQEYDQKLHHIGEELAELGLDAKKTINWYLSRPKPYKLKVYIPYLMDEIGRTYRYFLTKYICFYYQGTGGVPMMHFIFDFQYSMKSISPQRQGLKSLLNAPLYIAYNDRVEPSPIQPLPLIGSIKNEHSIS